MPVRLNRLGHLVPGAKKALLAGHSRSRFAGQRLLDPLLNAVTVAKATFTTVESSSFTTLTGSRKSVATRALGA